jgi:K+-transporting ATPase KdpF subunit
LRQIFTDFLRPSLISVPHLYTRKNKIYPLFRQEKVSGYLIYFGCHRAVGGHGSAGHGIWASGSTDEGAIMISLTFIYSFGATCAALLFAYLAYALIRAEEF